MNFNHQDLPSDTNGQSPGWDPKSSKRNSGLFSFLKWFKPSTSRESIDADVQNSPSSSCDSLNSIHSTGTVASFSYVPPSAYTQNISEKCIVLGPETDTYKARLKQRDKRRENDKNLTLRKKYNLFFNKDTFLKPKTDQEEENSRSLPLMTRTNMPGDEEKIHRRTNSESSKIKRAGAYLHVKGKRRAPAPPGLKNLNQDNPSTMSLKRKKRLAPPPPTVITKLINIQQADSEVICNDSLKLDHGILKAVKETDVHKTSSDQNSLNTANSPCTSTRSSYVEAPVSPRPWYKRNTNRDSTASSNSKKEKELLKTENKYEPIERLSQVQYTKNSSLDLTTEHILQKYDKRKDEKRKSGLSFLTNISELDREASEIIKKEQQKNENDLQEIPEFMRPKLEPKINTDSWVSPKRRSARDLIAKFNAITNVTKVTVFGISAKDNSKRDYFGKQHSLEETKTKQETLLESHKKRIEEIDKKINDDNKMNALMKSESASAVKVKPETPKVERKNWKCPKCSNDNDYWRIICHVCSAIKPYFDDFSSSSKLNEMKLPKKESKTPSPNIDFRKISSPPIVGNQLGALERSKTQIGFSALASYNANNKKKIEKSISLDEKPNQIDNKKEEKEKLKKMLIEMKNSLPKRKSTVMKQNVRTSIISENPENNENDKQEPEIVRENVTVKTQEQQVAEILIGTTQTIYENIKVKKSEIPKAIKVSSAVQTSSVAKKIVPTTSITNLIKPEENNKKKITNQIKSEENDAKAKKNYELMKPKDFENIYSDKNACASAAKIYANLAQNDELSLFFNMPKRFSDIKNNFSEAHKNNNTDTIEINRLLRRLETAIAKGELTEAAIFAKELAQLKINCSVVRQKSQDDADVSKQTKTGFPIEMFVEDKVSHRGPFSVNVTEDQTVAELKKQIEKEFEIPVNVQRWILGKELATNEQATLKDHHITTEGCPVFLYLVAPESKLTEEKAFIKQDQPCSSKLPQSVLRANEEGIKTEKDTQNLVIGSKIKETQVALTPSDKHTPKIVNVIPKNADVIKEQEKKVEITETTNFKLGNLVTTAVTPVFLAPKIQPEVKSTVVINEAVNTQPQNKSSKVEPKLVEVKKAAAVVKVSAEIESKVNVALQPKEIQTEIKPVVTIQTIEIQVKKDPPIAKEEEFEDYDASTLKPQPKEWECHLCTLLNPTTSNICAACATIRLLQIVAPQKVAKKKAPVPKSSEAGSSKQKQDETYLQLVNLDNADLVENTEKFECVICFSEIVPKQGVTLRECLHQFCKTCLANTIEYCEEAQVKCPYRDNDYSCNIALQDREIKSLVKPGIYDQYLARSVTQAENKIGKSFHCKTPDCKGWCIFEDNVNDFRCPVCRKLNCLTCQAIHTGMNCKQYQEKMNEESEIDDDAKRTKQMLDEMVNKGEALTCPTCKVILMKKWGCDWLRCSMCKTEICWVTRGPRWGPAGKGDTSGGCQCGVNGVKCHPQCNYCH